MTQEEKEAELLRLADRIGLERARQIIRYVAAEERRRQTLVN